MTIQSHEPRRRAQFSILGLFLVTAVCAISLAWWLDRKQSQFQIEQAYEQTVAAKRRALDKRIELEFQRAENHRLSLLIDEMAHRTD